MRVFPLHASCLPIKQSQIFMLKINDLEVTGGESGIRTHGRFDPSPVFKTGALNRSAISPMLLRVTAEGVGCHAGDPPRAGGPGCGRTNILCGPLSQDRSRARILACPGAFCSVTPPPLAGAAYRATHGARPLHGAVGRRRLSTQAACRTFAANWLPAASGLPTYTQTGLRGQPRPWPASSRTLSPLRPPPGAAPCRRHA